MKSWLNDFQPQLSAIFVTKILYRRILCRVVGEFQKLNKSLENDVAYDNEEISYSVTKAKQLFYDGWWETSR